jgi:hypothetical protein
MEYLLLFGGIITVLLVLADVASTTIAPHGAGRLTGIMSKSTWKVFRLLFFSSGNKNLLNYSGLFIILVLLFTWLMFLWAGYSMIYLAFDGAVINNRTGELATITDTLYFIGYSLSTLGYGDFAATTPVLKLLSTFISFTGLIMITTIVTYLVPVTMGELQKRKLSTYISSLGSDPQEMLINGWDGKNFSKFHRHFDTIISLLLEVGQSHLAYPILHYFHTSNKQQALSINIATLDEALTLLLCHVPEKVRLLDHEMLPLRQTITSYILTIHAAYIKDFGTVPPEPEITELVANNIPVLENPKSSNECFEKLSKRRRTLLALLKEDCWHWEDIKKVKFTSDLDII